MLKFVYFEDYKLIKIAKYAVSLFLPFLMVLAGTSCGRQVGDIIHDRPETVGFFAGGSHTRTQVSGDGLSVEWQSGDRLGLFASSGGAYYFYNKVFSLLGGSDNDMALFTAEADAMPEAAYKYIACYPVPETVSGSVVSFTIPSAQDGAAANGADVMVSDAVESGPLAPVPIVEDYSMLRLAMRHLVHLFRFYLPEGTDGLNGEPVKSMRVEMPVDVCGTLSADINDPIATESLSDGSPVINLELSRPLHSSTAESAHYACASVAPFSYSGDGAMQITLYSDHWMGRTRPVSLGTRDFAAGHATPVRVTITETLPYYILKFIFSGNNIGEDVQQITLTAPDGCIFGENGESTYVYAPEGGVQIGDEIEFAFLSESLFRAFDGKTIGVAYDSQHIYATQDIPVVIPSSRSSFQADLTAPYLLFEDFSAVGTFSSNDTYSSLFDSGNRNACDPFLGGWTGERVGASAGACVRLAPRRETSARYHSRLDSAPLFRIKSPVDIVVSFDYGMGEQHGGIAAKQYPTVSQVGYVTSTTAYGNGSTAGTFNYEFTINETAGSYSSVGNHLEVTIYNLPAGTQNRISWRAEVENHAGANNNTNWLYIDNVKVQVAH